MIGVIYVYYSTNIWATLVLMIDLLRRFVQKKKPHNSKGFFYLKVTD